MNIPNNRPEVFWNRPVNTVPKVLVGRQDLSTQAFGTFLR